MSEYQAKSCDPWSCRRGSPCRPVEFGEVLGQRVLAPAFPLDGLGAVEALQVANERVTIKEERIARAVPAEALHELDGTAAADSEQHFAHRTVDHRQIEASQFRENLRNPREPLGFGGHRRIRSLSPR